MNITQTIIDTLLDELEALVHQIKTLRTQIQVDSVYLEAELKLAKQEYDEHLQAFTAKADQLKNRRADLKSRLAQASTTAVTMPANEDNIPATPPMVIPPVTPPEFAPKPLQEDPRMIRKRALVDHLYNFLGDDQEVVIQTINALLVDESKDVGHILEFIDWGEIWRIRPEWESLDEQHLRLINWKQALAERLSYWQAEAGRFKTDLRYPLWEHKQRGPQQWQAFLDSLAQAQQKENTELTREISVLERELQSRMQGGADAH